MKKITIQNEYLQAEILPDFGAAVSSLRVQNVQVLRMDYGQLGCANVLAGGIPVLFPFVSKIKNDEAVWNGETLTMPLHGFVKDMPFAVAEQAPACCVLELTSNEMTKRFYPFDFVLRLTYALEGKKLVTTASVKNNSAEELPYVIGYHPYFLAPDRTKTAFSFGLKEYWNYLQPDADGNPKHGFLDGPLSLADAHDTVFWNGDAACEIVNYQQGYRARITGDASFTTVTICTTQPDAACIEPWQAKPGAAYDRSMCQILKPGEERSCRYEIEAEVI